MSKRWYNSAYCGIISKVWNFCVKIANQKYESIFELIEVVYYHNFRNFDGMTGVFSTFWSFLINANVY